MFSQVVRRLLWCLVVLVILAGMGFVQDPPAGVNLTPELIVGVVALGISLILDLVPGLSDGWESLPKEVKRWAWLIGCLVAGLGLWALYCVVGVTTYVFVTCDRAGVVEVLRISLVAYFSSQATHGVVQVVKILRGKPARIPDERWSDHG